MTVGVAEQVELQPYNTLALPARARYFARIDSIAALQDAVAWARARQLPLLTLGGGSNVVLAGDWPGLVLQIAIAGKTVTNAADGALVTVGAGENWHDLVQWTLAQGLFGLENLTLIPGTAGAAPIQNIGAYGVELAQRLVSVRGLDLDTGAERELTAAQCEPGYRDSVFKHALCGRFIITAITLRLDRRFTPVLDYPALRDALADIVAPDANDVERAVRHIRQSRLPDPAVLPNAGSFFKNPVVTAEQFAALRARHADVPAFPAPDGVKIPAAWLVERSGWKGRRQGAVGVHAQQALVLIHYPEPALAKPISAEPGAAAALLTLAAAICRDVRAQFGIDLEREPTVYGAP